MERTDKIYLFEYMISKIIEQYKGLNGVDERDALSAFSKLKLIKLNFFVSAIDADDSSNGLLDIFDNFHAMPYGHVESDVYAGIQSGELNFYKFGSNNLIRNIQFPTEDKFSEEKGKIDKALSSLFTKNSNILNASAFQLVELSHQWHSWRIMFEKAKSEGSLSAQISPLMIKLEPKYFELN